MKKNVLLKKLFVQLFAAKKKMVIFLGPYM